MSKILVDSHQRPLTRLEVGIADVDGPTFLFTADEAARFVREGKARDAMDTALYEVVWAQRHGHTRYWVFPR